MRLSARAPLQRILFIDQEVRKGAWPNASSLGLALEVSARTVQRDIDFMRDRMQAPLEFNRVRNGWCYKNHDYRLSFFELSEGEIVALFLAERLLQQYCGTPYGPMLSNVFAKLAAGLPERVSIDLSHLSEMYSMRQQVADVGDIERFRQLTRAVQDRQQLEVTYWTASRDETCRRVVDPYHLASTDGDWYLIGYCHLREDTRIFVPARIRELRETGVVFERPANFCVGEYLDAGFRKMRGHGPPQRIRLRFAPAVACFIREKLWHPTQELAEQEDGGIVLTVWVNHLLEIKRWAMSFGTECLVLEPEELRRGIQQEAQEMCGVFASITEKNDVNDRTAVSTPGQHAADGSRLRAVCGIVADSPDTAR